MATWDATQLATETLRQLTILGVGQSASAEDLAKVTGVYPSVYRQLRRLGLAPWPSDQVAEGAQLPLAKYLAGQLASSFGFSGGRLAEMKMVGQEAWVELQEQAAGDVHVVRPKFKDY